MKQVGRHIEQLILDNGYSQSRVARSIGVPRQLLSYVIAGKRELSMSLALKLESFFNLSEGQLLKMQTQNSIALYKKQLKRELFDALINANAFWSYTNLSVEKITDEELIEKTFTYLDMDNIAKLFELIPRQYIRKVWRERMAIAGDYLLSLNVMIALYYFDIKQPERYLRRIEQEHLKAYA